MGWPMGESAVTVSQEDISGIRDSKFGMHRGCVEQVCRRKWITNNTAQSPAIQEDSAGQ